MGRLTIEDRVIVPEGVTVRFDEATHTFTVAGPKGELTRRLFNPRITVAVTDGEVRLRSEKATQREKKSLKTARAHVRNMITGVQEGFTYKLKVCSGHFPMNVTAKDGHFEVKNFIGEKVPRTLDIKEGVDVAVSGDEVTVTATSKELAGQVAGDIEKLTRRPGFDTRIFQDGIFIIHKG